MERLAKTLAHRRAWRPRGASVFHQPPHRLLCQSRRHPSYKGRGASVDNIGEGFGHCVASHFRDAVDADADDIFSLAVNFPIVEYFWGLCPQRLAQFESFSFKTSLRAALPRVLYLPLEPRHDRPFKRLGLARGCPGWERLLQVCLSEVSPEAWGDRNNDSEADIPQNMNINRCCQMDSTAWRGLVRGSRLLRQSPSQLSLRALRSTGAFGLRAALAPAPP